MAKPHFEGQHEDEDVLLVIRRHPIVMRKGLLAILILLLISMIPLLIWPTNLQLFWLIGLALLLGSFVMFYYWIGWYFSLFIVTDQRFVKISQEGLFKRSVVDIGLEKIQSVNYQIDGIEQTLLGFGTIVIQTFVGDLILEYIHHPDKIQSELVKSIKESGYEFAQEQATKGL